MGRKPNRVKRPITIEALPLASSIWHESVPRWLLDGVIRGLLHLIPPGINEKTHFSVLHNIIWLEKVLIFPFSIHPQEQLKWTDNDKQEAVTKLLESLKHKPNGKPPDHDKYTYLNHAVMISEYLDAKCFPFRSSNPHHQFLWLNQFLPDLLLQMKQTYCTDSCRHVTRPPQKERFEAWHEAKHLTVGTLQYQILAYHHGVKYATAYKWINFTPAKVRHHEGGIPKSRLWPITGSESTDEWKITAMTNLALHTLHDFGVRLP